MKLYICKLPFKKCLPIIYTLETFINDAPQLGGWGYPLLTFLDKMQVNSYFCVTESQMCVMSFINDLLKLSSTLFKLNNHEHKLRFKTIFVMVNNMFFHFVFSFFLLRLKFCKNNIENIS